MSREKLVVKRVNPKKRLRTHFLNGNFGTMAAAAAAAAAASAVGKGANAVGKGAKDAITEPDDQPSW